MRWLICIGRVVRRISPPWRLNIKPHTAQRHRIVYGLTMRRHVVVVAWCLPSRPSHCIWSNHEAPRGCCCVVPSEHCIWSNHEATRGCCCVVPSEQASSRAQTSISMPMTFWHPMAAMLLATGALMSTRATSAFSAPKCNCKR